MISLNDAAQRLGVHYMTVYRYVRTGRLPAVKVAGEWRVDPVDVDRLGPAEDAAGPRTGRRAPGTGRRGPGTGRRAQGAGRRAPRTPRRAWATTRFLDRLLAGDEIGAWGVVEAALASGAEPAEVHLELLAPALRAVGERWEAGIVSVGDEHRASVVARRLLSRLGPRFNRPGRKRGVVVVGAVAGERHEIPGAIVADQLRGARFDVVDLGADTPPESFVAAARRFSPLGVLLGVTGSGHEAAVAETVAALRAETVAALRAETGFAILVGGAAVPDERAARALGADHWTGLDARQVVATVEELRAEELRGITAAGAAAPASQASPGPAARR